MRRWSWPARLAVLLGVWLAADPVGAEPLGAHGYLMPFGGYTVFDSDSVGGGLAPGLQDRTHVGARLGFRFSRWASLELAGGYTPSRETIAPGREVDFLHLAADVRVTPFAGRARPFLMVGGGASRLKPNGGNRVDQGNAEAGAGIDLWFTDGVGLRLEGRDVMWLPKEGITDIRTHTLILGAGLNFAFGARARDTDADGVPDRKDACPDTPAGAKVAANGCPIDSDADRVFDGLDRCEGTPKGAVVDAHGCPTDLDGDGVADGIDQCADTPKGATVDGKGCPLDADADGVFDGIDQCDGTPKGATVDARGCPADQDGDGIADGLDQCPSTDPDLKVDVNGCPIEVIERETELMDTGMIRLQNVNFQTAKWDILPESMPLLDIVGQVMTRWPDLRIEVGGHTDARGGNAYNQTLSQKRAESVLAYLKEKFPQLKPEQFTAKGYGESRPIAPNTTVDGMARNRRVEFVVLNKDALKREVERRRLLKANEGKGGR